MTVADDIQTAKEWAHLAGRFCGGPRAIDVKRAQAAAEISRAFSAIATAKLLLSDSTGERDRR